MVSSEEKIICLKTDSEHPVPVAAAVAHGWAQEERNGIFCAEKTRIKEKNMQKRVKTGLERAMADELG